MTTLPQAAAANRREDRTSDRLRRLAEALDGAVEGPTLGDLAAGLGRRAYGLLLLICCLGCAVPGPPGSGVVLALPMIVLAAGMMAGHEHPRLPRGLSRHRIPCQGVRAALLKSIPLLTRLERVLRPRGLTGVAPADPDARAVLQDAWTGALVLFLAVLLALPVPLTNLPLGAAIVILALGVLERDMWATVVGTVAALGAALLTLGLTGGAVALAASLLAG